MIFINPTRQLNPTQSNITVNPGLQFCFLHTLRDTENFFLVYIPIPCQNPVLQSKKKKNRIRKRANNVKIDVEG